VPAAEIYMLEIYNDFRKVGYDISADTGSPVLHVGRKASCQDGYTGVVCAARDDQGQSGNHYIAPVNDEAAYGYITLTLCSEGSHVVRELGLSELLD
jgi:hypothetical protein